MKTARDKFWMFGVRAHQDDIWFGKSGKDRNYSTSRITPAEGALMLDVPNMVMVNCDGIPVPFSEDAYGYAESFCHLDRVLWGSTGSGGFRIGNEEAFICKLAEKYPNIHGAFLDDCFGRFRNMSYEERHEKAIELMAPIRAGLDKASRYMEIYGVCYTQELPLFDKRVWKYFNGLSLWTGDYDELPLLEERFIEMEKNLPNHKKLLGIYMFCFRKGLPVPINLMELQCELGLKWMREGRLDGMIFEANSVMGIGLPSEKWLREWIAANKDKVIPD